MRFYRVLLLTVLLSIFLAACSSANSSPAMAPLSDMPAHVQAAPVAVRESYQFAVANPDVLKALPCYCGCGDMGHTSNYACYVQNDENGKITFDDHALGCSICVDITQDAMRMLQEGKSLKEIRASIDATYSRYGPSNIQ